jgi:3-methylfumaryl-CoA hydratase
MESLGPDGHPAKNLGLPPVPQPRRMWAGGEIESFDALRIGDAVTRISTITDVTRKIGQSGELWFVAINHDYETERGLAIRERQDIVYREAVRRGATKSVAAKPAATATPARVIAKSWTVSPSPVLLFRYSAITFNGHRIHYDYPYATGIEGYDGLVVHGPMQATLLYNLATVAGSKPPRRFNYRGVAPAIAGTDLMACRGAGEESDTYWTQGPSGHIHMEAKVEHA